MGQIVPPLIALGTIPFLIHGLGTDRFGVLNLAWVVITYFGLFDLGLERATTRTIAEKVGLGREADIPALLWTSLSSMFVLGAIGALVAAAAAPLLTSRLLDVPATLTHQTTLSFVVLAVALPFDMMSSALRGALEARGRFDLTAIVRFAQGLLTYLGPVLMLIFTTRLELVVATLVVGRIVVWLIHLALTTRAYQNMHFRPMLHRHLIGPLLRTGGWMNVSSAVYPLMVTLDRFMIGAIVSLSAVAWYATPYETVTRLWAIPVAISAVLFPAFSANFIANRRYVENVFLKGVRYVFLGIFPFTLAIAVGAHDGLSYWVGKDFADHGGRVLQFLAIGVCVNSISNIPFALAQGGGRSDRVAKLHLTELPIYVASVWIAANSFGITGVAVVWMVRSVIDTGALLVIAGRMLNLASSPIPFDAIVMIAVSFAGALLIYTTPIPVKIAYLVVAGAVFGLLAWVRWLDADDRSRLLGLVAMLRRRISPITRSRSAAEAR